MRIKSLLPGDQSFTGDHTMPGNCILFVLCMIMEFDVVPFFLEYLLFNVHFSLEVHVNEALKWIWKCAGQVKI